MATYNIISADSHMNTPRDMYEKYAPANLRDRMPRAESTPEGDFWVFEGKRRPAVSGLATMAGRKFEDYTEKAVRFADVVPGSWDVQARVADQKTDGLDAEVIYSGAPLGDASVDPALRLALYQTYNDWLADFSAGAPERIVGLAAIPMWDPDTACAEARRAAAKGLKGLLINSWSETAQQYHEPFWDPVWATFAELGLPVSMHLGARPHWVRLENLPPAYLAYSKMAMAEPLLMMLFGGPLVRHPGLRIVLAEAGIGWLAYLREWIDTVYRRHRHWTGLEMPEPPSHYFERQVFSTFQEDKVGVAARHVIGVGNIMWASDYPHSDTTWPESRRYIEEHFVGVPAEERHQIVAGNAARLYHLN
jgi:predicted TIM-barrel fold metal-dependent hydrolase